jgi:hypothetical protein
MRGDGGGGGETEREGVNSLEYRAHEGVWHPVVAGFSCRDHTGNSGLGIVSPWLRATRFCLLSASQGSA